MKTFEGFLGGSWDDDENPINNTQKPDPKVRMVASDEGDWYGLYIDGKLKCEGHTITGRDVLNALNIKFKTLTLNKQQFNKLGDRCPVNYNHAKKIKFAKDYKINPNDPYNEENWESE